MTKEDFYNRVMFKWNELHPNDTYPQDNIFPPGCDAQFVVDLLFEHFFGDDRHMMLTDPVSNNQCNTIIGYRIIEKTQPFSFKKFFRELFK